MIVRIWNRLLDLVYPRRATCLGCGSMLGMDRDDVCDDCRKRLAKNWVGVRPPEKHLNLDGAAYAYKYVGPGGSMVRNLKYRGAKLLADEMSAAMARAVNLLRPGDDVIVTAVPMHSKRMRRRGFNHAALLAQRTAEKLELEYAELLIRTRNAPQQARLSHAQREKNLKNGFAVHPDMIDKVRGAKILLLDDVFTTGGTACACADALKRAGARRVYFTAFTYGERKEHG